MEPCSGDGRFEAHGAALLVGSDSSQRVCMRSFFEKYDWHPMEDAPFDEDVELFVTDVFGSFYDLRYRAAVRRKDG